MKFRESRVTEPNDKSVRINKIDNDNEYGLR